MPEKTKQEKERERKEDEFVDKHCRRCRQYYSGATCACSGVPDSLDFDECLEAGGQWGFSSID